MKNKGLVWLGIVLGIVFFVVGFVYATHTAMTLPSFFPGYEAGEVAVDRLHTKHAIAAFIAGVACFIVGWFQSAPKKN